MASTSKPNTPNLEGAAAAAALWTPTGGRVITVRKQSYDPGKYFLEIRYAPRASSKFADLKSITSLHEDYPGKPGFLGCYHQKSWVTEAAARAAIDHFRAWVDGGRRKQTAAATARSNQPAAEDVVLLPERYSERRNFRVRVDAMLRPVSRASGVVVKLMLLTSVHTTTRDEYNRAWSRSSDALRAVRKRRAPTFDVARALGQTVADAELAGAADTRAARVLAIRVIKGRGKARRQRVGMHRNRRAIVTCFSRLEKFLPLARVRKYARKTRAHRRAYREGQPNSLADVEKLIKGYKSHRSADVFDKKFCHADE